MESDDHARRARAVTSPGNVLTAKGNGGISYIEVSRSVRERAEAAAGYYRCSRCFDSVSKSGRDRVAERRISTLSRSGRQRGAQCDSDGAGGVKMERLGQWASIVDVLRKF